jgi:hypothetical protein
MYNVHYYNFNILIFLIKFNYLKFMLLISSKDIEDLYIIEDNLYIL